MLNNRCDNLNIVVSGQARTCRDELTDDDILLKADERILLALDSRIGEHSCGLLERCRRQERICGKGSLGDTEQHSCALRQFSACLQSFVICVVKLYSVYNRAYEQIGVTGLLDLDFADHLTNDNLDMLIIDIDTLEAVNPLNLLDEIIRNSRHLRLRP